MSNEKYEDDISPFAGYLKIVWRYIWMIVGIFVVVVSIVTIWNIKAIPVYRASVKILIEPDNPNIVAFEEVRGGNLQLSEYYATQVNLIKSRSLAYRVVKKLNLANKRNYGYVWEGDRNLIEKTLSNAINLLRDFIRGHIEGRRAKVGRLYKKENYTQEEKAVNIVLGRLSVAPINRTRLVIIHYEDEDPRLAAKVANTLSNQFSSMNLENRKKATEAASNWLSNEIKKVRQNLERSDRALQSYKEKFNLVSLEDRQNIIVQKLKEISSAVTLGRTKRIARETLAEKVKQANGNIESLSSMPDVIDSPVIQAWKLQHQSLIREQSDMFKRYKRQHPKLVRLTAKVKTIEKKLREEIKHIAKNIIIKYQVAKSNEESLLKALGKQKEEALKLDSLKIKYDALKRDEETNRNVYERILQRTKETDLLEGLRNKNIRIVDKAEIPKEHVRPRRIFNILASMAASSFMGLVFAFFLDAIDNRVRSVDMAEKLIKKPVIGVIPTLHKNLFARKGELIFKDQKDRVAIENFRQICTMTIFKFSGDNKVLQVTSSIPREGKTFISSNLSIALVKSDKKVLLIDGDFYRSTICDTFNINSYPGIIDYLLGEETDFEKLIQKHESFLDIIPSGDHKNLSTMLFESHDIKSFIEPLRNIYDYIIIDTPPILSVNDTLVWSQNVDGVLFVVDVLQTNTKMVKQSIDKFNEADIPIFGVILNRMTKSNDYYYYGYITKGKYYS